MIKSSKKIMAFMLTLSLLVFYGLQTAPVGFTAPAAQTVPTRTPIPAPTDPPAATEPPKKNNNPQPTAPPLATETPIPVTLAPTPIDGYINPDRCGDPYFIASLGAVNVRSQPSTDSEILTKMVYLEARQILARAADVSWWQILLPDTSIGWVFDSTGSMIGLMDTVPVINPDGSPAAEPFWQPTPDLFCPTPEPSPTPTATATPPPTEIPSATPTATATSEPSPTHTVEAVAETNTGDSDTITPIGASSGDIISPLPDSSDAAEGGRNKRPAPEQSTQDETLTESNGANPPPSNGSLNWPILAGAALILFGFGALMLQRRQEDPTA